MALALLFYTSLSAHAVEQPTYTAHPVAFEHIVKGDYDKAIRILKNQTANPLSLWNMAVAYARSDKLGWALATVLRLEAQVDVPVELVERASQLRTDLVEELVERARQRGDPDVFDLPPRQSRRQQWYDLLSIQTWRWLAYLGFWLGICLILLRHVLKQELLVFRNGLLGVCLVLAAVAGLTDFAAREARRASQSKGQERVIHSYGDKLGVVVVRDAPVRDNCEAKKTSRWLAEGVIIRARRVQGCGTRVTFKDGRAPGFVPDPFIELVR
tara:strand:- start:339 stop:1148 length:810 start_codon:yes stop_codon:yes gene_type:complete